MLVIKRPYKVGKDGDCSTLCPIRGSVMIGSAACHRCEGCDFDDCIHEAIYCKYILTREKEND